MSKPYLTPIPDKILVVDHIVASNHKDVAIVFLHGLGDVLMFSSVWDYMLRSLPGVKFTLFLLSGFEPLIPGSRTWTGDACLSGFDVAYVLEFPMSEGSGELKSEKCARLELGIDGPFDVDSLVLDGRRIVAVHFQATALPGACNAPEPVARRIWEILVEKGMVPIDVHFTHCFHNPVNVLYPWAVTNVRGQPPSVEKLYSLIEAASVVVAVASGPMVMTLAINPGKLIYLENHHKISDYTRKKVSSVKVDPFSEQEFRHRLSEKIG